MRQRGRPRLDGLNEMLPGPKFIQDCIRALAEKAPKPVKVRAVPSRANPITGRDFDFIERYRRGETLAQIAASWGISLERVRQRLAKYDMRGPDGGQHLKAITKARDRHQERLAKFEARSLAIFGVSHDVFRQITGLQSIAGIWTVHKRHSNPISVAYINQKRSAEKRSIGWNLNLADWWRIWQESGKWAERGRGYGYCMARWGDDGPYSPENVYICTCAQNSADSYITKPAEGRVAKRRATMEANHA